jgi:hypothetical protein
MASNFKLDTDRIIGLTALLVGVGSLVVVVYQTQLTRQAQYASVRPYLYIQMMANDDSVGLLLTNSGIGPALIDDVRVRYKAETFSGDPFDFFVSTQPNGKSRRLSVDKVLPGRLIPAGTTISMLGSSGPERLELLPDLLRLFEIAEVPRSWYEGVNATSAEKAVIEIIFSSVYGDRWRVRSDRIVPEPL